MLAPLGMLLVWPFMLIFNTPVLHTVYCGLGVVVFTLYLAYGNFLQTRRTSHNCISSDTKTIVGGGRHELGPDDWIIGVVEEPTLKYIFLRFKMNSLTTRTA